MEDPFCSLKKFFPAPVSPTQWTEDQQGGQVGQTVAQINDDPAEQQEIHHPTQDSPCQQVEPDHPISQPDRVPKEGQDRQGPVEQIQQDIQERETQPPPEEAAAVVEQTQPAAQGGRPQKGQGLTAVGDLHPLPQQAGEKTAPALPVGLVGQGLHMAVHLQISAV